MSCCSKKTSGKAVLLRLSSQSAIWDWQQGTRNRPYPKSLQCHSLLLRAKQLLFRGYQSCFASRRLFLCRFLQTDCRSSLWFCRQLPYNPCFRFFGLRLRFPQGLSFLPKSILRFCLSASKKQELSSRCFLSACSLQKRL